MITITIERKGDEVKGQVTAEGETKDLISEVTMFEERKDEISCDLHLKLLKCLLS